MSTKWLPDQRSHLRLVQEDGRAWDFPAVRVEEIAYHESDWAMGRQITLVFSPLESWTVSEPTPETKQEKRRRLIKELYPAGSA